MADEKIVDIIKKYVYLLNKEGFGINKAFLYGSFALGSNSEDSDIDLMLVTSAIADDDINWKSRAWILTRNIDSRIEPYLVSLDRFIKDEISPIIETVRREGIEIQL